MSGSSSPALGVAFAVMAALSLSTAGIIMRHLAIDAWEIVFWRCLFAALALAVVVALRSRGRMVQAMRGIGAAGLFAGLAMAYMLVTYCLALEATLVANVVACLAVTPFLTALIGWLVLRERVAASTWIGMALALAGVLLIVVNALEAGSIYGNVLALSIAALYAGYLVIIRRKRAIDMLPASLLAVLLAMVAALPFGLPFDVTWGALPILVAFGAGQLAGGLVLITLASRHVAAAPLSLIMLIEAVGGVLWTWLGVGEAPAGLALVGALLVLLAALGNALYGLRRRRRPALAG
ncbi:MAG: DMT family transporter [Alphaproteobacteria bacterium]